MSSQVTRKNHSGKPGARPFSAPTYLKSKPTDQRGNLQALDGGFMILKLKPKLKPAHSAMEVQKKRVPEPQITNYFTAELQSTQDQQTMATEEKDDYLSTEKSTVTDVGRNQGPQDLEQERKVKFCPNGNLSDALNGSSLLKDNLTNEGEKTEKTFIHSEDTLLKKKKLPVPLCIEDEIEKPNAKVIRVGSPKAKSQIPVKMSESFPIFIHNGGYMENYVLNRWLALYRNKAFYDMNKRGEGCMHLNPVLQNNYNESIAIIGSKKPPNLTVKRKKKPTLSGKPKRITIQILSVEKARCNVCASSKKETQFVQKTGASVTRTINSNIVTERNSTWNMPTFSKDTLMIQGVNLKSAEYPDTSSSSLISRMKSQLPINSVEDVRRKGRMIFVDYIPISKPLPIHRPGDEVSPIYDPTKTNPGETNKSFVCHQDMFDQRPFQDGNRAADMELIALQRKSLIQEGRKGSRRRLTSSASLKGFSLRFQKLGNRATRSEEQYIMPTHSEVISIPTAQFETTESHRDQSMQDFNDNL
ncbi:uncharacterized protein LOC121929792 isoform X2 [Sceloporus undulatus]|nr:uncharacterized protein LOC121929792 isoform X2 [Sceloporus undulatus]